MNFLKQIFTCWNKQTLGTFIHTLFTGKFVGKDQFGDKYYSNSNGKRWVVYKNQVESSKDAGGSQIHEGGGPRNVLLGAL